MDDFEGLSHDFYGGLLLTCGSAASDHAHVHEALNNGTLDLLESALLVAASRVRNINLLLDGLDLEVVCERHVAALHTFVRPLAEEFGLQREFGSVVVHNNFIKICVYHEN